MTTPQSCVKETGIYPRERYVLFVTDRDGDPLYPLASRSDIDDLVEFADGLDKHHRFYDWILSTWVGQTVKRGLSQPS